jgi:hypothetical protein
MSAQPCPTCGEPVTFDRDHFPPAWRHAHESRWCEAVGEDPPRYPPDVCNPGRVVAHPTTTENVCPDCAAGKCANCTGEAWDLDADAPVECLCERIAHS